MSGCSGAARSSVKGAAVGCKVLQGIRVGGSSGCSARSCTARRRSSSARASSTLIPGSLAKRLAGMNVRLLDTGPHTLRAVTNLTVSGEEIGQAIDAFEQLT